MNDGRSKEVRREKRRIDPAILREYRLRPKDIPKAKALFLMAWEATGFASEACKAAGIGRRTFYDWLQTDSEFKSQAIAARKVWRTNVMADLEASMALRGQYKDTLSGIFLLKHNTKRYREVSRVQLSGPDGGPIMTIDAKEELIRRIEKIAERMESKPIIAAGGSEVRELAAGSQGLSVVKSEPSGPRVRKARGVRYG
jgi:hypothetical protein